MINDAIMLYLIFGGIMRHYRFGRKSTVSLSGQTHCNNRWDVFLHLGLHHIHSQLVNKSIITFIAPTNPTTYAPIVRSVKTLLLIICAISDLGYTVMISGVC